METKVKDLSQLKVGDLVLIDNPLIGKDDLAFVASIHDTYKYPISDQNGVKQRSLGRVNGSIKYVTAESEGCKGDEKIKQYCIMSNEAGDYTFKEGDDYSTWNIRKISKNHPKYNPALVENSKQINNLMNFFGGMFGGQ